MGHFFGSRVQIYEERFKVAKVYTYVGKADDTMPRRKGTLALKYHIDAAVAADWLRRPKRLRIDLELDGFGSSSSASDSE